MNKQIGILAVLQGTLSGALLATPSLKVTNAQGNETAQGLDRGDATRQGITRRSWIPP